MLAQNGNKTDLIALEKCVLDLRGRKKRQLKKRESNNPLFITVNTFTRPDTASKFSSTRKAVAGCMIGEHFSLFFVNLFRQSKRETAREKEFTAVILPS